MYVGRPIMPGRTEVEQLHQIFKLCGSPSKDYWKKMKLPASFRPPQHYKPGYQEAFGDFPDSSFGLLTKLLALDPSYRGTAASALQSFIHCSFCFLKFHYNLVIFLSFWAEVHYNSIYPFGGRMTLLLGPPGCGKSTLLLALSGKLSHSLKVAGEITYNGYRLEEFFPQKTSTYISQYDLHTPEKTVREILDFFARFQGIGSRAKIMKEVNRREKQAKIVPDPDIDAYMKAISVEGQESTLQTDYILKIHGLDICADTMVGDAIRRGISGGQKKRLTTGEMIVGPTKALFMDEISNGLDSSTTF